MQKKKKKKTDDDLPVLFCLYGLVYFLVNESKEYKHARKKCWTVISYVVGLKWINTFIWINSLFTAYNVQPQNLNLFLLSD